MVEWEVRNELRSTWHSGTIGDVPKAELASAVAEVWARVIQLTTSICPDEAWDILIAYVDEDRVLAYPASKAALPEKSCDVMASLRSEAWTRATIALSEIPDDSPKFDAAYGRKLRSIARTLKEAIADPAVSDEFKALKRRPGFGVYCVDALEVVRRENLTFLWGNAPPKGLPAGSAKEIFEALIRRASSHPPDLMAFKGEILRHVTFFGNEFDDKYVDLLETVPDLASVCKGLLHLDLKETRIKPAAVDRLRRLLPKVKVRVFRYTTEDGWFQVPGGAS